MERPTLSFSSTKHTWLRVVITKTGIQHQIKDADLICHEKLEKSPLAFSWLSPQENMDLLSLL